MTVPDVSKLRRAGLLGLIGGMLSAISGLVVQGVVQPATDVPDDRWSYPWSSTALVPVSLVFAVFHLLVFAGILGFARSGVAGPGRAAKFGSVIALVGTVVLFVAELLSIPIADQKVDDTGPGLVGACFGLGSLLSAIGFIMAGIATVRAARWVGWRRFVPLASGLWLMALVFLAATPALAIGVTLYGFLVAALGAALLTQPTPSGADPRSESLRV